MAGTTSNNLIKQRTIHGLKSSAGIGRIFIKGQNDRTKYGHLQTLPIPDFREDTTNSIANPPLSWLLPW